MQKCRGATRTGAVTLVCLAHIGVDRTLARPRLGRLAASRLSIIGVVSLYERLGGEGALMAAVSLFYDKVCQDPSLARFFDGLDMDAQTKKQVAFMARALGGPGEYWGRSLREAHAHLIEEKGLAPPHFDAVARHLRDTLNELGVTEDLVSEVLGRIARTKTQIFPD